MAGGPPAAAIKFPRYTLSSSSMSGPPSSVSSPSSVVAVCHSCAPDPFPLVFRIKCGSCGEDTYFKIKTTTALGKAFDRYKKRHPGPVVSSPVVFTLSGRALPPDTTPRHVGLVEDDVVVCEAGGFGPECSASPPPPRKRRRVSPSVPLRRSERLRRLKNN